MLVHLANSVGGAVTMNYGQDQEHLKQQNFCWFGLVYIQPESVMLFCI